MNINELKKTFDEGTPISYHFFWGGALSNWSASNFTVDDVVYHNNEQYLMAQKALTFHDNDIYCEIMVSSKPNEIKKLGRKVKNYDDAIWNSVRDKVMFEGAYAKFSQNPKLKQMLLDTGDKVLVEASPYDKVWGIGMEASNPNVKNPHLWKGENRLGFVLMSVREMLKEN